MPHSPFCNLVGGQDELVFDGHSVIVSERGETLARGRQFTQDLVVCDLELPAAAPSGESEGARFAPGPAASVLTRLDVAPATGSVEPSIAPVLAEDAEVYEALVLGLRDYVAKNHFERVLVALSGGIDSALVALIAADALGPDRLTCVVMPSPYSSEETQADARAIARNLGADLIELPIEGPMHAYEEALTRDGTGEGAADVGTAGVAAGPDLAAENIQARIRGNLMMALSNRSGWLVLTTGNKSEMSVGYATLYGDMAGGFAVLKDVPKTLVYRLVRHRNERQRKPLVPESVLDPRPQSPSCARISATRTRCRPTSCSTGSSRPTSRAIGVATRSPLTGSPPIWSTR